jgi:hypothetical protein
MRVWFLRSKDGHLSTLLVRETNGRAQEQPAFSAADCPQLWAGAEEHSPAHLIDGLAGALHDVKRVVNDRDVVEPGSLAHGLGERLVHVHRQQHDARLLLVAEPVDPGSERLFAPAIAEPNGLAGFEIAHDRDELLATMLAAAAKVLLVDPDKAQPDRRARLLPALDGGLFCPAHRGPVEAVQQRHVRDGHRRGLNGQVLLQAPRLTLMRLRPSVSSVGFVWHLRHFTRTGAFSMTTGCSAHGMSSQRRARRRSCTRRHTQPQPPQRASHRRETSSTSVIPRSNAGDA